MTNEPEIVKPSILRKLLINLGRWTLTHTLLFQVIFAIFISYFFFLHLKDKHSVHFYQPLWFWKLHSFWYTNWLSWKTEQKILFIEVLLLCASQLQSTSQALLTLCSTPVKQINTGCPVLWAEKEEQKKYRPKLPKGFIKAGCSSDRLTQHLLGGGFRPLHISGWHYFQHLKLSLQVSKPFLVSWFRSANNIQQY